MRKLAIVLNLCLFLFIGYMLVKHGLPKGDDILFAFLFTIVPALSILALWNVEGHDWLSLYFRRKTLEEQRKIDELNAPRKT